MFGCKHKWTILDRMTVPSVADEGARLNATYRHHQTEHLLVVMKVVYQCSLCGKLHTEKLDNGGHYNW